MSDVQPFCFENTVVRTITRNNEPWFVARDVCDALELENITHALAGLDDDELTLEILKSGGQDREMKLISESGLYALIFKSRKPQARLFRRWVTHEVLPAIRKTGSYAMVPAKKEKQITIDNHYHKHNPANPHGIQYRLDLTRIVARPTRQALDILTRLTGVDFSDIDLGDSSPTSLVTAAVDDFIAACCQVDPNAKEGSTRLYQAFVLWLEDAGVGGDNIPSHRALGLSLKYRPDLSQRRYSEGVYWIGLRLTDHWQQRVAGVIEEVAA